MKKEETRGRPKTYRIKFSSTLSKKGDEFIKSRQALGISVAFTIEQALNLYEDKINEEK